MLHDINEYELATYIYSISDNEWEYLC